jgi:hypothetical protein
MSYLQPILVTAATSEHWWIGDKHSTLPSRFTSDPTMLRWLGRDSVEELAAYSQRRIEAFYQQAATVQGKIAPAFFAERFYGIAGQFATPMMWELYPNTRQIVLVRDLRDMLCSMLAFNEKNSVMMFGRKKFDSDVDFALHVARLYKNVFRTWKANKDKVHLLRYEDLVLRPEETLASTTTYLGLESGPATIRKTLQRADAKAAELQHQHKTSSNPSKSIGRWRRDLDPALQTACWQSSGDVLEELGYG